MGIAPNPSNMCVSCIRSQVDITEPVQKKAAVMWCKECGRYLNPPRQWIVAQPESKELLTHCIKRLKGLNKVGCVTGSMEIASGHSPSRSCHDFWAPARGGGGGAQCCSSRIRPLQLIIPSKLCNWSYQVSMRTRCSGLQAGRVCDPRSGACVTAAMHSTRLWARIWTCMHACMWTPATLVRHVHCSVSRCASDGAVSCSACLSRTQSSHLYHIQLYQFLGS